MDTPTTIAYALADVILTLDAFGRVVALTDGQSIVLDEISAQTITQENPQNNLHADVSQVTL